MYKEHNFSPPVFLGQKNFSLLDRRVTFLRSRDYFCRRNKIKYLCQVEEEGDDDDGVGVGVGGVVVAGRCGLTDKSERNVPQLHGRLRQVYLCRRRCCR